MTRIPDPCVPFVDLAPQWAQVRARVLPELEPLFEASAFSLGPWVAELEDALAGYLGVRQAIAVSSGSAALHLAVVAAGIGPGDRVLVPAHSFIGTIWGLLYQGAVPVFCDVEEATGTIDFADAARRLATCEQQGLRVRAIVPVHLYGQAVDIAALLDFAMAHGLEVIEDAAQAIGARWQGRALGSFGAMGCFSFYPAKNLGAAGEGGLVVTDDMAMAARLRALRDHGQRERYVHEEIGYNYRMDAIQALVLSAKLEHLDGWTEQRRVLAARYNALLADTPLRLPRTVHGSHVHHLYVVRASARDALRSHLERHGVQTGLHYPVPLYRQPCLAGIVPAADEGFARSEDWACNGLSLPLFAGMSEGQQDRVIAAIHGFFAGKGR